MRYAQNNVTLKIETMLTFVSSAVDKLTSYSNIIKF